MKGTVEAGKQVSDRKVKKYYLVVSCHGQTCLTMVTQYLN